ncbi:MAG TPA: protein kinase [Pyrinomonadaceae bacterium]|nr:protein kinase [Pyrinomonadaceae bacterium]
MANEEPSFAPGQHFGPYSLVSRLGSGGMGEIYLAQDTRLGRQVALKFLPPSLRGDSERLRRFQNEARAASALNHPNVATVYEIGEVENIAFIAMEYIEGVTLDQKISGRPLNTSEIVNISIQVADALDDAHSHGVVHRDIKTSNVMLTRRDQVKVLDFGLAKVSSIDNMELSDQPTAVKTLPGLVMGTVQYMSPEQAVGQTIDARSDIWSFGVVLYEMATGRKPFVGDTTGGTIEKIRHSQPEAIARFNYEIPPELERIIRKCLEKDRENRYQSARELMIDLKNLRRDLDSGSKVTAVIPVDNNTAGVRNRTLFLVAGVLILSAVVAVVYYVTRREQPPTELANIQIKSVAVLPFKPLVADNRDETLELGMADTLITKLSNIRDVDVRPISAVRKYTGLEQDAIAAGREQQVDAVLDGVIQRAGNQVRVSVRFLRVNDGSQLWSGQFQENMTQIFAVQDSISERVASALALTLAGGERQQLTKHHTENAAAYELYLKGRFQMSRLTDDGFLKGRDYFQQAIGLDQNYALAHAALADSYVVLGGWNVATPRETFPKAREAAVKALQLDPSLAEPHATLAMVSFAFDWDWNAAEQEFKRALDLNPNYPDAHQLYGYYLAAMKRFDEALGQMQRAKELDPASLSKLAGIGEVLNYMGRTDEAKVQYEKCLEMDPNSGFAHWSLGNVYVHKRMYDQAIAQYQKAIPLSGTSPDEPSTLAYAYAKSGKRKQALDTIAELIETSERRYISWTLIAAIYAALGDHDEAFKSLQKAIEQRDGVLPFINIDPIFEDVRSDDRYAEVLKRVGLPN